MKKTILLLGGLAFVLNLMLGLLLSAYDNLNMGVNCGVILANTAMLWALFQMDMRDAFRIAFSFIFSLIALVEICLGSLMPDKMQDNACLITLVIFLFIKLSIVVIIKITSDKITK